MNTGNKTQDARSIRELKGVNPHLCAMVRDLSTYFKIVVTDGLRTVEEQANYVLMGKSKTLNSKHLTGDAVDIMRFDNGKPHWELPLYAEMAVYVRTWSIRNQYPIRWGGSWHTLTNVYDHNGVVTVEDMMKLVDEYTKQCRKARKRPLIDGPHFETLGVSPQ
ncbi:MAG: hypothetical protein B7Z37_02950 [Verrucomicrobia bacterium 12-59-8]|nr:MAG: hypothetical protein B7Z37_02950 [Verrucomicrobia bacterium 12-59-8]